MSNTNQMISAAIGGLLVMGLASGSAAAADVKMEKCYGIAKAGKNDCGSKAAGHSCAGQASRNGDANDFIALPVGTCGRIVNGATAAGAGMMKK